MVQITVGEMPEQKETFSIHKDFICQKVPFFKTLFDGPFNEAITQSASFPEDDLPTFRRFIA